MQELEYVDVSSNTLARRGLLITVSFAIAGLTVGLIAAHFGVVIGPEIVLVCGSLAYCTIVLAVLLFFRQISLQMVSTVSTVFFIFNLCTGVVITLSGRSDPFGVFVYLFWFFPLLVFNKLVNGPVAGRVLFWTILGAPFLTLGCLLPHILVDFNREPFVVLAVFCICYVAFGFVFGTITRYREEFLLERERMESLKLESEILESISDCFISLDGEARFVYLNDAACAEFGVERRAALQRSLAEVAPGFFSHAMRNGMETALANKAGNIFEAQNRGGDCWYAVRCYPRMDGMSVYFRNITESVALRQKVEATNALLREQAELLDKAKDAIFVVDMDMRINYWNKSAERLYGWSAEEVIGQMVPDIFQYELADVNGRAASVLRDGEWNGEILQYRRDGSPVTVDSHCTLVRSDDGRPQSVLAINTDITSRKVAEAKIEHLAFYDPLTELPNRQLLQERIAHALTTASRKKTMGALLFIDLDDFKTLNDTRGHETGDLLLQQVALRLMTCVRSGDTVARFGGDEFVVVLEGLGKDAIEAAEEAKAIAETILEGFLQPYKMGSHENDSTASIGITIFPKPGDTADDPLKRSELAMYQAKAQGRNTLCFFDPLMQTRVTSRAELRAGLRLAVQESQFELHYQPQMDNKGGVIGAEALLRWRHPRRGMVTPNEFIPLAEDAGLIVELGRWVLGTACEQLAKWATQPGMEHLTVAVNVSVRQFLDSNFVNLVHEVLGETGANPQRLKLEITESSVMEKIDEMIAKMTNLNASGIGFSLDDFGTGYSSLSHLKRLPLHQLKIDRSFVTDVLTDAKNASIARTIITLGKNLNLSVIAEGVETEGQRSFLEKEGCYFYQGYLFSKALPAAEFEAFVASA